MYFVGIDIAKYKHDCFIFTSEGEIICESFSFENNSIGFTKLQMVLDSLDHSHKIKIGLEATGIYGKNLKLFLSSIGYDFDEINPLQVKRFSSSLTNRKTKTDKIDASHIARFISTGASRTYVYSSCQTSPGKSSGRGRVSASLRWNGAEISGQVSGRAFRRPKTEGSYCPGAFHGAGASDSG